MDEAPKSISQQVGPGWWAALEAVALSNDLSLFQKLIEVTKQRFPCESCRQHFAMELTKFPPNNYRDITNVDGLSPLRWVWTVHNSVNERIHKPQVSWDAMKNKNNIPCAHKDCTINEPVQQIYPQTQLPRSNRIQVSSQYPRSPYH